MGVQISWALHSSCMFVKAALLINQLERSKSNYYYLESELSLSSRPSLQQNQLNIQNLSHRFL